MNLFEQHEQFEMAVLDSLRSARILEKLVFGGGTMLRLCHELNRYSVDLDFYLKHEKDGNTIGDTIKSHLGASLTVRDFEQKRNTVLLEVSSPEYPRKLKIEINTQNRYTDVTQSIAWSAFSNVQVMVTAITLDKIMALKINALLDRKEIRDAFDIEFLIRRGISMTPSAAEIQAMKSVLNGFKPMDYKVKLGSILTSEYRDYYNENGFSFLLGHLNGLDASIK